MTIVEFLEARLNEDEADATEADGDRLLVWSMHDHMVINDAGFMQTFTPSRILREVAAKRAIIAASKDTYAGPPWEDADIESGAADVWDGRQTAYREVLANLASAYSDHPDYQKEWAL